MNIAFIGFGKVAFNLSKIINDDNINFVTSNENRSCKTVNLINESNIRVFDTFKQAIEISDIVISANSPSSAYDVALKYRDYCKGIFIDLNNISPETACKISGLYDNFVDAAIIGKIDSSNPTLFLSGDKSDELLFLNDFLNVNIVSKNIGDASKLKLLRSTYTKSLSVLLIECYELARKHSLDEDFFNILSLTEGDDFRDKSLSRINNTVDASERKKEEISEIIDYFGDDLFMVTAAYEKLRQF